MQAIFKAEIEMMGVRAVDLSGYEDGGNAGFSQTMVASYRSFYDNVLFQVIHYLKKRLLSNLSVGYNFLFSGGK
jgi:hypothetical protein